VTEKIAKALAILEAEGLSIVLEPSAVIVKVGSLEILQPDKSVTTARISLDGVEIQKRLVSIELRMKAAEITEAEIHLGVIP
jgi:hypothetical protein